MEPIFAKFWEMGQFCKIWGNGQVLENLTLTLAIVSVETFTTLKLDE